MASDTFGAVDILAREIAKNLGEAYEDLDDTRASAFRRVAYSVHESLIQERDRTLLFASECMDDLMTLDSTPKRWLPGLKEGAKVLRTLGARAKLGRELQIPDVFTFDEPEEDPFSMIEAGDVDPYDCYFPIGGTCGHEGDGGYTCSRPPHDPSWQHFDSDARDSNWSSLFGTVLATWDSTGGLTSLHPEILDSTSDGDDFL